MKTHLMHTGLDFRGVRSRCLAGRVEGDARRMCTDELIEILQGISKVAINNRATVGKVFIECRTAYRVGNPQLAVNGIYTFEAVARCRLPIERKHH
ncbi:hypothetical protein D3C72_1994930 [compost metagenome]